MVDKEALRKTTLNAQHRQQTEHAKEEAKQRVDDEAKRIAEEQKAQEIIRSIPEVARAEAEKGSWSAPIMTLSETEDYDRSKCGYDSHLESLMVLPEALIGAARTVFEYCEKAGLQPSVERIFTGYRSHYWTIEICWQEGSQEKALQHRVPWYRRWFRKGKAE